MWNSFHLSMLCFCFELLLACRSYWIAQHINALSGSLHPFVNHLHALQCSSYLCCRLHGGVKKTRSSELVLWMISICLLATVEFRPTLLCAMHQTFHHLFKCVLQLSPHLGMRTNDIINEASCAIQLSYHFIKYFKSTAIILYWKYSKNMFFVLFGCSIEITWNPSYVRLKKCSKCLERCDASTAEKVPTIFIESSCLQLLLAQLVEWQRTTHQTVFGMRRRIGFE